MTAALDQIERKIGTKQVRKLFKSITGDCGSVNSWISRITAVAVCI